MNPSLLTLRGVSKSFGSVQALQPLDLDLAMGEVLGLVGETGAGKSTLAEAMVAQLNRDSQGRAAILRSERIPAWFA